MTSKPTARDTQFLGFAKALFDELPEQDSDFHPNWKQETLQIIAQRAYDLIQHALETCLISERAYDLTRSYNPYNPILEEDIEGYLNRSKLLAEVPDLTTLPEVK